MLVFSVCRGVSKLLAESPTSASGFQREESPCRLTMSGIKKIFFHLYLVVVRNAFTKGESRVLRKAFAQN